MLYEIKIKVTSPWLGDKKGVDQVRRFQKRTLDDGAEGFSIDLPYWCWALGEAIDALHIGNILIVDHVRVEDAIKKPTLVLHNRRWYDKVGKPKTEMFESIRENTTLNFKLVVTKAQLLGNALTVSVTKAEIMSIFNFIGKYIGLSPWGNKFGYGRFRVVEVVEL